MFAALRKIFWFFGLLAFLSLIFLPSCMKWRELKNKNRDLEGRIKQLKIENVLLEEELKRVANDPVYQEMIARDKMGIVRKGEIPIKIVPSEKRNR